MYICNGWAKGRLLTTKEMFDDWEQEVDEETWGNHMENGKTQTTAELEDNKDSKRTQKNMKKQISC